jgi:hypothetical protein
MMPYKSPLISYIAPGAPATRRRAEGNEAFLRPEIGFTPKWYRERLGIDFGKKWHTNPAYRLEAVLAMRAELARAFPGAGIGDCEGPIDLLTGTFGACAVAGIYGIPVLYAEDNWPNCAQQYLHDYKVDTLKPPDLDQNPFFEGLMAQVDWIAEQEGMVRGFINWQGILNNAHRLRGEALFQDLLCEPKRCRRLFACICETMIEGLRRLQARQAETGFETGFVTISNCLVNMLSGEQYRQLLWPFDKELAETFGCIGVHNCAWNADPYVEDYARLPQVAYIDMGQNSDLVRARELFPHARRALMYPPTEIARKSSAELRADFERIARDYGPCDIVAADIEAGTPDERVLEIVALCKAIGGAGK